MPTPPTTSFFHYKGLSAGSTGRPVANLLHEAGDNPKLYAAFVEIKQLFDPENILNPGSIVGGEQNPLGLDLKFKKGWDASVEVLALDSVKEAIEACSGCGKCRTYCPVAKEVNEEWVMARAKATLVRGYLDGTLDEAVPESPRFREILDACVNCKRCLTECPSGSDIPWVAISGRALAVQRKGEAFSQKILTNTRFLCEAGSALAPLVNLSCDIAPLRWGLEAVTGLDRRRYLPKFHRKTLRKWIKSRPRPTGKKCVAYFLSCYSNFNDPKGDGLATVEVLERNGFEVLLPDFRCCGIARLSSGAVDRIEGDIRFNLRILSQLAEEGVPVVFSEPSCALAVKMDTPSY